ERRRSALAFVFVGGGYAGVEALGELEDLARDAARSVPTLDPSDLRWVLVEATGRILPELDPDLAAYAEGLLEGRGIEILKHTTLESLEGGVVRLSNGRSFPADTVVWTAGVTPSPLARASGFPVDPAGRVLVDSLLRVRGVEDAWAAGDAAAVPDLGGGIMPPTAQHGIRQGRRVAANLSLALEGRPGMPFVYRSIGSVCSLGRYKGVASIRGFKVRGFPAWFLHRSYHLFAMPTIPRRVKIAMDWTVALLFPRDIAQLGVLERPRESFARAAPATGPSRTRDAAPGGGGWSSVRRRG
ncbi:MAG TPA: FAD-dependent oxidoreductase, partial [Actinomycetota bacterium]|nr:FAD-dependent oxidoreductase [Actinomycetota bacterium]